MEKIIVIFCCEDDEHAVKVKGLISAGFEPILLEREKYGTYWSISCFTDNNETNVKISLGYREIFLKDIHSIYLRRDFTIESQDILGDYSEGEKKYIATQRSIHVNSCIKYLSSILPTVNTPGANHACLSKVLQLDVAQRVGLKVPNSFVGGSFEKCNINFNSQLCIKPLEGVHLKEGSKSYAHYAELLEDISKESLKTLELCPAIIQSYIPKEYELRITVVGSKIFPCKIESQKSRIGNIDWRHHDWANTPHYRVDLPRDIEVKILLLMGSLELSYGAIDMIFDGNEYYFLEINSMGQWLWIEDFTEMPISQAMAELLCQDERAKNLS
jgi:glutathione synthase/RimK-type ligase-like ATP-grasp enzyme